MAELFQTLWRVWSFPSVWVSGDPRGAVRWRSRLGPVVQSGKCWKETEVLEFHLVNSSEHGTSWCFGCLEDSV